MSKLKVGVVGLGRGASFVKIFSRLDFCEVRAVFDPDEKALKPFSGLSTHTRYDSFLAEDLDLVAVISPGPVHADQSIRALKAGAHVLCETPCVYSVQEARSVVETARRTGLHYMLAEDYIWSGWAGSIRRLAEGDKLGDIVYAEGDYTHDCRDIMLADSDGFVPYAQREEHPDARRTWRATDLPPLFYCSHTLGPLLWITGDRAVSAVGLSTGTRTAPDLGTIDLEAGLFESENGAVLRLTNGFTVAHPYSLYYSLVGTRGSVKLFDAGSRIFAYYSDDPAAGTDTWEPAPGEWSERPDGRDQVEVMVEDFVESVRSDSPPPIGPGRSMDFVLPGIRAHESSLRDGVKLEVPGIAGGEQRL